MRHPIHTGALMSMLLLGPIGCDPQATTDYQGEPLFEMTGRVELALGDSSDATIVPSIAFMAPGQDQISFLDAEVSGEFPAQFQISLYTPPPAEVLGGFPYEDLPDEPRHTIGFISAVTEDHLDTLYYIGSAGSVGEDTCDDDGNCYSMMLGYTADAAHSGTITIRCTPEDQEAIGAAQDPAAPWPCEIVGRTGDPMFASFFEDPMFAGAAVNYAVAYLESDAAPGSVVARRFGSPGGLSAGYHLMAWGEPGDETAKQACRDEALQEAADRYNAAHGTTITGDDYRVNGCGNEPGCMQVGPHTRGLRGEWYRVMAERDCLLGPALSPVTQPQNATVSLQVQRGLSFVGAALGRF